MFEKISTVTAIQKHLRPKYFAEMLTDVHFDAVNAQSATWNMVEAGTCPEFLAESAASGFDWVVEVTTSLLREEDTAGTPAWANDIQGVLLSTWRLWNALVGKNQANIAYYSLELQARAKKVNKNCEDVRIAKVRIANAKQAQNPLQP